MSVTPPPSPSIASGAAERFERARELFGRAVGLDAAGRAELLERECRGDAELRARVMALLAADDEESAGPVAPGGGRAWLAGEMIGGMGGARLAAGPGEIGGMAVVREIGRGGMGIVYEAWQKEPRRRVALKVIHPALLSPGALERFGREIRAMAALTHPGIVQLYGVGGGSGGDGPHLVMELVEGASLREWAATERGVGPGVGERLRLLAEVCDAVHHAHQKGVVHRDLKPENILVVREGGDEGGGGGVRPKVLDFGVSRLLEDDGGVGGLGGPQRTIAGQVVGTVPYLSPEQAEGDAGGTDTRSDVYALGVIAFELLAGEPPFDVRGLTTTAAIRRVLETPHKRLRAAAPSLDADVQTVVHKAMARDPSRRYASAAELAADLRRAMANEPVLARAPSWGYLTRKFVRRHRVLAAVAGVSGAMIVASVVAMAVAWADARRTREAAVWQRYLSAMSAASVALPTGDIATARRALESTPEQHRGWEFAHLYSRLDQSRRVVRTGRPGGCVAAEVEGLGLCMAGPGWAGSVDAAGGVRPLDPRLALWIGAHASVLPGPVAWTEGVVHWSAGGAGDVRDTRLAHWPTWAVTTVQEARATADGRTIALRVSGAGHAVVVGRLPGGEGAAMEIDPGEPAARIDLSADGRRVAVAFDRPEPGRRVVRVFDAGTGREVSRTAALERSPVAAALSPDGEAVVIALQDGSMQRWDVSAAAARRVAESEGGIDPPRNLRLSPDGGLVVGGSRDGLVRVWDAATLRAHGTLSGHETALLSAGFGVGDGRGGGMGAAIVTTGTDGTVRMWDPTPGASRPLVLGRHADLVHAVAIGERARRVYTGSWDRTVEAFSLDTGERVASATLDELVQHLAVSPDGRVIAVREHHRPARVLDAGTLGTLRLVDVDRTEDAAPLFSADSRRLVVGIAVDEGVARVVDIESGEVERVPLSGLRGFVGPTIGRGAGLIALSTMREGTFVTSVCRLEDGREVLARPSRRIATESMAFSADGSRLAIVGAGDDIDLFDTGGMTRVGTFRGHSREVLAMAFSPDGRRLFSADFTGVIRVWDTRTCDEVGQLRGHEAHIRRLAVSADGKCLVSGSRDGTARVWAVP